MSTTQTAPSRTASSSEAATPRRRRWIAIPIGIAVVALAAILWVVLPPLHRDTHTDSFDADLTKVHVDVNGAVIITAGERTTVTTTREWGLIATQPAAVDVDDGVLRVQGRCETLQHVAGGCATNATVTVGPDVAVMVSTQAGAIDVTGMTAGVDLTTLAGDVNVTGVAGPAHLRTSAGSINGSVNGGTVEAWTSAGDIRLQAAGDLRKLSAESSAGTIDLTVPDFDYQVDAQTDAGETDVDVRTNPNGTRSITARTSAGNIAIGL